ESTRAPIQPRSADVHPAHTWSFLGVAVSAPVSHASSVPPPVAVPPGPVTRTSTSNVSVPAARAGPVHPTTASPTTAPPLVNRALPRSVLVGGPSPRREETLMFTPSPGVHHRSACRGGAPDLAGMTVTRARPVDGDRRGARPTSCSCVFIAKRTQVGDTL